MLVQAIPEESLARIRVEVASAAREIRSVIDDLIARVPQFPSATFAVHEGGGKPPFFAERPGVLVWSDETGAIIVTPRGIIKTEAVLQRLDWSILPGWIPVWPTVDQPPDDEELVGCWRLVVERLQLLTT